MMTREEAQSILDEISVESYTYETGMGRALNDSVSQYEARLTAKLGHPVRVILSRAGEYSRWCLTCDPNDPREHYMQRYSRTCICCGKTEDELRDQGVDVSKVNRDDDYDDEQCTDCGTIGMHHCQGVPGGFVEDAE